MNKKKSNTLVIYADKPVSGQHYFYVFLNFLFLSCVLIWFVGLYIESDGYRSPEDSGFLVFLFLLVAFAGWRLWSRIKRIIDIQKEKPLIKINPDGIEVFGDEFRFWKDIEYFKLVNNFDQKYIELKCLEEEGNMNYSLDHPSETAEFKNLTSFKDILEQYTDKGLLEEY